jgi:predicted lipoprotein with Yx(FWY)xxD motif
VKRLIPIAVITAAAIAVLVAVGGGNAKKATNQYAAAATPVARSANATIRTARSPLGTYLVDGKGRTLYLFEADKPNVSNCSSACISIWPAFVAKGTAPVVKGGVMAAKLGTTTPRAGTSIITYNGHPLYYYVGDQKPGATTGQGLNQFGGGWYVVTPAGDKIDKG